MKKYFYLLSIIAIFSSCRQEETQSVYSASEIHRIPYGQTGTLAQGNYTGQGAVTIAAGTTVNIQGYTTVDAISLTGKLHVPVGAVLVVNGTLNVGGGTTLDIDGTVITRTLTQVGNIYMSSAFLEVNGRYTIGGGTTLFIANSEVEVDELVITGHIQGVDNLATQAANWYSLIELTGAKYLNRGGGTNVCGPVLFSGNIDEGSSGATLVDVTEEAVANNAVIKTVYGLPSDAPLYQYNDACTPLIAMPAH